MPNLRKRKTKEEKSREISKDPSTEVTVKKCKFTSENILKIEHW